MTTRALLPTMLGLLALGLLMGLVLAPPVEGACRGDVLPRAVRR